MKSIQLMLLLLFFALSSVKAQKLDSLHLKVQVQNYAAGEPIFIAYYLGENKYLKDTLWTDANGVANYYTKDINKGLYLLILKDQRFVEFLVAETHFSIYLNAAAKDLSPVYIHSLENSLLQQRNYVFLTKAFFEQDLQIKQANFSKQFPDSAKSWTVEKELINFWTGEANQINNQIVTEHSEKLIADVIKGMSEPSISNTIPKNIKKQKLQNAYKLNQFKKAYFSDFDFANEALLYTPVYQQRLNKYLDIYTVQNSDSLITAVDFLIKESSKNEAFFRFTVSAITNKYAQLKLVCASQKVYAHIVNKYYKTGLATWVNETEVQKMEESVAQLALTACAAKMPDLLFGLKAFTLYPLDTTKAFTIIQFLGAEAANNATLVTQLSAYLSPEVKANTQVVLVLMDDISAFENSDELVKRIPTNWTIVDGSSFKTKLNYTYNLGVKNTKLFLLNNQKVIQAHSLSANQVSSWVALMLKKQ